MRVNREKTNGREEGASSSKKVRNNMSTQDLERIKDRNVKKGEEEKRK